MPTQGVGDGGDPPGGVQGVGGAPPRWGWSPTPGNKVCRQLCLSLKTTVNSILTAGARSAGQLFHLVLY